jgi:hypothetical protein
VGNERSSVVFSEALELGTRLGDADLLAEGLC